MTGHDPDIFVDPVPDAAICAICFHVMNAPVGLACGHSFCCACLAPPDQPELRDCPFCRAPINAPLRVNYNLMDIIGCWKIQCQNQGCAFVTALANKAAMINHEASCQPVVKPSPEDQPISRRGGAMDWIPVYSQVKSLVQAICRDSEGARITQENFSRTCPVVSQSRSLCEALFLKDGHRKARETQMAQLAMLSGVANALPVVGHVKGAVHYAAGDHSGGDAAMKGASRSVGVLAGGVGGFVVGGPAGAIAGGIVGGAAMDGVTTGVESAIHRKFKPNGLVALSTEIATSKDNLPGNCVDLVGGVVLDGLAGLGAGRVAAHAVAKPAVVVGSVKHATKSVASPNGLARGGNIGLPTPVAPGQPEQPKSQGKRSHVAK
eukprot:c34014_g1_i1.p1 GENE.c34014_g1_i1~~c34014_g1_i1.p1  ORF type:complete len:378 (+),score=47.93 c34014_g1_i1:34-1167(+)